MKNTIISFCLIQRSFLLTIISLLVLNASAQDSLSVSSPDGKKIFKLFVNEKESLFYEVSYNGTPVVLKSGLGIKGWENSLGLKKIERKQNNSQWKPVYGERALITDNYNEATFVFLKQKSQKRQLNLQVRAYNEGIVFRYFFPEHKDGGSDIIISEELTEFVLPAETKAWFTGRAQGAYSLKPLNDLHDEAERPLTLELKNGLYVSLAEAQMVDYCRTKFALNPKKQNTISCAMYDKVELTTPFVTPWRVIMIAEKATQLLENNDIILNLNPPCAIEDTSWIKPGKIIRETTLSTSGSKELVDFAVKRHLQYIHFDAGWYGYEYITASDASKVNVDPRRNPKNDLDLQEVIKYAKEKGIGVFLYVNQRALTKQLDQLLPLYQKWGVAGLKFGFVHVGSHRWTTWLHDAIKKCAQYNLMVDIHDEYRPTGFSRTYPNLLTQEGVMGNEEMPVANNNAALPFTRFLCGPADYTISYYHRPSLKKKLVETQNTRVLKTTSMHQMALSVIFYSPLQFMYWYDKPEDSQNEPELEFFDHVPTVWDDTKVIDGEIGKFVTVARRSGKEWFVGTITNNDARDLKINCSFLEPGKKYEATIYYDDPKSPIRTLVSMKKMKITSQSKLDTKLLPSGGQAIWIRQVK